MNSSQGPLGKFGVAPLRASSKLEVGSEGSDAVGSGVSDQRRRELADFLRTRREKLKPEQVGIMQVARRRTPGLRREEVAELAGVGTTWYTWLEQARDIQPSGEVLRRLGHALRMTPAEVRHLFSLAGKAAPLDGDVMTEVASESTLRVLNHALRVPAILVGARWDVLHLNELAKSYFPSICDLPKEKNNWLYYVFCLLPSRGHLSGWETNARRLIAEFRASIGDSIDHPWVHELVETLHRESPEFAMWWKEHDVRDNDSVLVEINHDSRGPMKYERSILRASENPKFKFIIFTPLGE